MNRSELIDEKDRKILLFLQDDIPVTPGPFARLSGLLGIGEDEICERIHGFIKSGLIRKYGAILRHRKAGYTANAMVVWKIVQGRQDDAAAVLASSDSVSHIYSRPDFPDWNCNLFSMIHAHNEDELSSLIKSFADQLTGYSNNYRVLPTVREFKKTSMIYYVNENEK